MCIWYHRFGGVVNRNWLKTSRLSAFKGSNPLTDTMCGWQNQDMQQS